MFPIRVSTRIRTVLLAAVVFMAGFAGSSHEVQPGDTLSDYAERHKTTVAELVRINGIRNPNHIVVGTTLQMPGSGSSGGGGGSSSTTNYRIRPGDTLGGIASAHGTSVSALVAANGISNKNLIIAGRTIKVPGSSSGSGGSSPAPSGGPGLPGQRHTVTSGESIGSIAAKYGLSSRDLASWNGIIDGRIYATTRLMLYNPGTLPGSGGSSEAGSHIVRAGESLGSIAAKYGTSIANVAYANAIANQNLIRVGQRLTIPGGGGNSGAIRCPVPGGRFFNDWAFPRSGGRSHAGNDLFAARGTPVRAPVSGRVEQANGSLAGRAVRVFDSSGGYWYVAHLDGFGKSGNVSAGDIVGYVGTSGNAAGGRPHAHVEYRNSSRVALNPYPILRAAC